MFEGMNGDLVTMAKNDKFAARMKFQYDWHTKLWQCTETFDAVGFNWSDWLADDSVVTYKPKPIKD